MNTFNTESTTNLTPADRDIKTTSPLDKWRKGGLINSSTQTEQPTVPAPQLSPEPTPTPESPKRNFWSRLFDRPTQPLHDTARDEKSPHVNHDNDNSGQVTFDMPGQRTKEEKREEKPTDQQEPQLSVFGGGTSFADSTAHFASEDTTNDNPPPTETKDRTNSRRTFLRNAGLVGAGILGIKGVTALAQDVSKILAKPVPQFPNPEAKQDASATKPEPSPSPSPEVTPSPVEMIKKEAYYGDNLTRSAVSVGEYKKTEEYKTNPLEETTKYYVLKDYPGYKEILNDPKLVRMLGRVHQIINAEIRDVDFENIASTGDYGQETVDILEKAYIDLLINAWNKSDQFAKLDNLFNVFKHPPKDTKQRDRREKAAADELYGFLKLVANKEHAKSAQVRDGKIYNDFPSGKWDYPASTYQNSNN